MSDRKIIKMESMWDSYEAFVKGMATIIANNNGIAVYPPEKELQVLTYEKQHPEMWDVIDKLAAEKIKREMLKK